MSARNYRSKPYQPHFAGSKCKRCDKPATTCIDAERLSRSNNWRTFHVGMYCDQHAAEVMKKGSA